MESYIKSEEASANRIYEFEKQIEEIDTILQDTIKKLKRGISVILGLGFLAVNLYFYISLFIHFKLDRTIWFLISALLVMTAILNVLMFIDSKKAINITASATAPYLAIILIFMQYKGITYLDMVDGIAAPLIILTIVYGFLLFIANILDWMVLRMAIKINKDMIEPIKINQILEKLMQMDAGIEFHEKFLFDEQFRNRLILFILKYIKILEKHKIIKIDEYDVDDIINRLESELDDKDNSK